MNYLFPNPYMKEINELREQVEMLSEALEAMFPYTECQCYPRAEYEGECLGCGYEDAREKARQALVECAVCREGLDAE